MKRIPVLLSLLAALLTSGAAFAQQNEGSVFRVQLPSPIILTDTPDDTGESETEVPETPGTQEPSGMSLPYGAHRYWGIEFTAGGQYNVYTVAELSLAETRGGPNMATGGTPGITSNYPGDGAERAFDGSTGTWASSGSLNPPQRLWYDFSRDVGIHEIKISSRPGLEGQSPTAFRVIYSDDGQNWTTAWSVKNETYWYNLGETRTYGSPDYNANPDTSIATPVTQPHGKHRYWGLRFNAGGNDNVFTVDEVQFRPTPGGASLTGTGMAHATSHWGDNTERFAFDNAIGSIFSTNSQLAGEILWYDFGAGNRPSVVEIAIYPRADRLSQSPTAWDAVYSDDGQSWTTAWSATQNNWNANWYTFTSPNAN